MTGSPPSCSSSEHMFRGRRFVLQAFVAAALAVGLAGCRGCTREQREVVVYTSIDRPFSEPVFRDFEKTTGVRVTAVYDDSQEGPDVLARLQSAPAQARADVFWSGDPVRPFTLINKGMVESYSPPQAASIPSSWRAPDGAWTGFAARARVLIVNRRRVPSNATPKSIRDMIDPAWKNQTAMANPLHGTTTMQVAAWFASWGETRARAFLESLKSNGVRVVSSNEEVARLVVAGEVAFGLADTDDAHVAMQEAAHVAVVYPDQDGDGTLVMPTSAVLMSAAPHPDTGRALMDYLVSEEVELHMVEQAAHLPLRPGIPVPPTLKSVAQIRAMAVDYGKLAQEMERVRPYLEQWSRQGTSAAYP